jgi:aubergine
VRDLSQPMLLVKPSNKAMRRRRDDVIALIPEFCNMTGLTDKMKADFRLMKAVAVNTKLSPEPRRLKVLEFVRALAAYVF